MNSIDKLLGIVINLSKMKDLYQNKRRASFKNRYSDFREDLITVSLALLVAIIWGFVILNFK